MPVLEEIDAMRSHLVEWARPQKLTAFHDAFDPYGEAYAQYEPLGVALILAPWNYPVQLLLNPLVGSMAAGNCSVVKPSRSAPATAQVLADLVAQNFDPGYIQMVLGAVGRTLIDEPFDTVFFTGSVGVGKQVMKAAAEHLAPVTLELGGKSPCIVDREADLDKAARRIVWGKFFNDGQTCVAPDYVLAQQEVADELVKKMVWRLGDFYGQDPQQSQALGRIVNADQFDGLVKLLGSGRIAAGGQYDRENLYIAPTIQVDVSWDDPVMAGEIFGPILPVLTYAELEEAIGAVNARPKPLALYVFTENPAVQEHLMQSVSFGGGCSNDVISHQPFSQIPFGGVGMSGMGAYHGVESFKTFSHRKTLMRRSAAYDDALRFPPYGSMQFKILKALVTQAGERAIRPIQAPEQVDNPLLRAPELPPAAVQQPQQPAPALTLTAVGSGRRVKLDAPGVKTLLLVHSAFSIEAASAANEEIRKRYPAASALRVANVVDLHIFPGFLRGLVDPILMKNYTQQQADLGRLTEDYVVILPDWKGAVRQAFGFGNLTRQIGVVVIDRDGGVVGAYQGDDPVGMGLRLLEEERVENREERMGKRE